MRARTVAIALIVTKGVRAYASWLALSGIGLLIGGVILLRWSRAEEHAARHRAEPRRSTPAEPVEPAPHAQPVPTASAGPDSDEVTA